MNTESKDRTYIQCLNCGHIYIVDRVISFEKSIINSCCPKCEYECGLHCGHNEDDVYELKDPYLSGEYFNY